MLHLCKPGFESILRRELALYELSTSAQGTGWVASGGPMPDARGLCFASLSLLQPTLLQAPSVNAMQRALEQSFRASLGEARVDEPWLLHFMAVDDEGVAGRLRVLEGSWRTTMARKMARVFKLATPLDSLSLGPRRGFFVVVVDFERAYVGSELFLGGQRRMKMDPEAPSRSFLKIEEALAVFGEAPGPRDTVVDLGAAPGGWSYAAARRGANVTAVDNGPLKGAAHGHPHIRHQRADAFRFTPQKPVDWLLCDMIESPDEVVGLLARWLDGALCRRFVVNLKCGKTDPIAVLGKVLGRGSPVAPRCSRLLAKQLHHDREEITVMGSAKGPPIL
jgi:23S rRNA (cytidine2498-2'-O)-methyltransferase